LGVPFPKFLAVDALAALVSVPTQILLVAIYGDVILQNFKTVKMVILGVVAVLLIWFLIKKLPQLRSRGA
jgi:membrane protein DedA with SNARE-associated domain